MSHESKARVVSQKPVYAAFGLRFRAVLIDGLICFGVLFVGGLVTAVLFESSPAGRIAAFVLIAAFILSYEPLTISGYGGTFGHQFMNVRVVGAQTGLNLSLGRALVRTLVKMFFGLFSMAFMFVTNRAQSLHDLAAGSLVTIRNRGRATAGDYFVPELPSAVQLGVSKLRRVVVILIYNLLLFLLLGLVTIPLVSPECVRVRSCTAEDRQVQNFLSIGWLIASATSISLGWTGRLPGCRRKRIATGPAA